ncbi:LOB domain-containing protein 4 [Senna tora]|uniref:LOB domain-containing protein 4 n=1 Tax=Senna tora TaxID=362788 RepID=A0A834WQM0_9FABA|nr:LOB domain-containing protein 4 [Senna tora]
MKGSSGSGKKQTGSSPCAACKLLRRRCDKQCVFAPYFPAHHPHKFINVHKVYDASNVNKMLQKLPVHQRGDAVSSMVYEANVRVQDPVYGCVGAISSLQHQLDGLRAQLALAQTEVATSRCFLAQPLVPPRSHHHRPTFSWTPTHNPNLYLTWTNPSMMMIQCGHAS